MKMLSHLRSLWITGGSCSSCRYARPSRICLDHPPDGLGIQFGVLSAKLPQGARCEELCDEDHVPRARIQPGLEEGDDVGVLELLADLDLGLEPLPLLLGQHPALNLDLVPRDLAALLLVQGLVNLLEGALAEELVVLEVPPGGVRADHSVLVVRVPPAMARALARRGPFRVLTLAGGAGGEDAAVARDRRGRRVRALHLLLPRSARFSWDCSRPLSRSRRAIPCSLASGCQSPCVRGGR